MTGLDVTPSLRVLLGGSVDYAGLFPPAALALEPALDNLAAYTRGGDEWMLGRFVLPVAKMVEAGELLAGRFDASHPLRISALGTKSASADEFLDGLRAAVRGLDDLRAAHGPAVMIDQFEAPLPPDAAPGRALVSLLRKADDLLAEQRVFVFWEVPFSEELPALLRGFAELKESVVWPIGAKLRTGGTEAAAFPSTAQLAAALAAARDAGVPLKFTAGLHHPFRRFDASVAARMHGFVNVFVAGALIQRRGLAPEIVQTILEDEDPTNFHFDAEGLQWRDRRVASQMIGSARGLVTSFGSCSFDEPRDDLRRLGLIE